MLILRVVLYWILCLIGVGVMLLFWRIGTGPARLFEDHLHDVWHEYFPALVASLMLLPLAIVDMLRLSNRFVGPLLRLRRSMRQIGRGEIVQPLQFRREDLCQELAEEYNSVLERLQRPDGGTPLTAWKPITPDRDDEDLIACA